MCLEGFVYNLAAGVKTFVWLLAAGADGNEYDDFGIIHGITNHDTDFTPRPVFSALQNTNALFSDTKFDPSIEVERSGPASTAAPIRLPLPGIRIPIRQAEKRSSPTGWRLTAFREIRSRRSTPPCP